MVAHHSFSSTIIRFPVVPDHYSLVDSAEERCPINGMIITQVAVVSNVDVSCTDFLQGLELQRCDALLLEDKQGEATIEYSSTNGHQARKNTEVSHVWGP